MELFQLLGDFVPQTPYRGSARGPHWGTYVTQTPLHKSSPHNSVQVYAPAADLSLVSMFCKNETVV